MKKLYYDPRLKILYQANKTITKRHADEYHDDDEEGNAKFKVSLPISKTQNLDKE